MERGWISRGNRAGTYILPKPPSRFGSSASPRAHSGLDDNVVVLRSPEEQYRDADFDLGFAPDDRPAHQGIPRGHGQIADQQQARAGPGRAAPPGGVIWTDQRAPESGGRPGWAKPQALSPQSSRQRQQPRVPLVPPGHRDPLTPAMVKAASAPSPAVGDVIGTSDNSAAAAAAAAAATAATAQMMASLHLGSEADEREVGNVNNADGPPLVDGTARSWDNTTSGTSAALAGGVGGLAETMIPGPAMPVEPGGATKVFDFRAETAAVAVAAPPAGGESFHKYDIGNDDGNPLPEDLLGIVMAGLEPTDGRLCTYCCTALVPQAQACALCGTPAANLLPPPDGVEGGVVKLPMESSVPAGDGGDVAETVELPPSLVRAESGVQEGPAPPTLPAGVLAVNNLAEVRRI